MGWFEDLIDAHVDAGVEAVQTHEELVEDAGKQMIDDTIDELTGQD